MYLVLLFFFTMVPPMTHDATKKHEPVYHDNLKISIKENFVT